MDKTNHPVPTTPIEVLVLKFLETGIQDRLERLNNGEQNDHTETDHLRDLLAIIGDAL